MIMVKKYFIIVLIAIFFTGCGKERLDSSLSADNTEELGLSEQNEEGYEGMMTDDMTADGDTNEENKILENSSINEDNGITDNFINEQDVISDESQIEILNFLQDGTFWATEMDEAGEQYIIHADIRGNVMARRMYDQFGKWIEWGTDNNRIVSEDDDYYYVFDMDTGEEISDKYVEDYDEIDDVFRTDDGLVFSIKKTVDSFEEEYECFKLVDANENILFEISLDKNTLLNEYGIEKSDKSFHHIGYCLNNVYYIPYVGDEYGDNDLLNSLIIDLSNDKVIPVPFPGENGLYYSSDGDYTLVYSQSHEGLMVNNNTSEYTDMEFIQVGYFPDWDGELSEHKFLAEKGGGSKVILDVEGNVVIDLNNYGRDISDRYAASEFVDGVAFIRFKDDYSAFIDSNGEILFEPIKGQVYHYYDKQGIALIRDEDSGRIFSVDKSGKKEMIELPAEQHIYYVEYEGKNYWVEGGEGGLHAVEIE